MLKKTYKILSCGDSAVTVEFSDQISPEINRRVIALASAIEKAAIDGIEEIIPTYRSFTICYNPVKISRRELEMRIRGAAKTKKGEGRTPGKTFFIPVAYGSEFGPDLQKVADHAHITPIEVVRRHVSRDYRIYMLGFLPGFPYLSGMDPSLETPRLENPRTAICAGSVGIGGKQTGIYPLESPGGWNLIGRTPLKTYDPQRTPPVICKTGDSIRFIPVTRAEYERIEREIQDGTYRMQWEES